MHYNSVNKKMVEVIKAGHDFNKASYFRNQLFQTDSIFCNKIVLAS